MTNLFGNSTIQVIQGPGTLTVIDPPYYGLGLLFLALGVLFTGFSLVGKLFTPRLPIVWVALIPGLVFLVTGLALFGSETITTLSKASHTIVIGTSRLGHPVSREEISLGFVKRAIIETDGTSRRLVLLLKSGQTLPTNQNLTDREGYYQAADAINRFIIE